MMVVFLYLLSSFLLDDSASSPVTMVTNSDIKMRVTSLRFVLFVCTTNPHHNIMYLIVPPPQCSHQTYNTYMHIHTIYNIAYCRCYMPCVFLPPVVKITYFLSCIFLLFLLLCLGVGVPFLSL